ncbi:hypothetical protein O181_000382, partial [Austropuccinia psidii MF-1]|nr:hypothetical protein [Austropuccinia psidii MF-1]
QWYDILIPPQPTHLAIPEESGVSISPESYSSPAFPLAVEKSIRHSLRLIFDRLAKVDLVDLVINKILPILTAHVEAFRQAEYDLRGGGIPPAPPHHRSRRESRSRLYRAFFSSGNDEIDLLLSRLHADALKRKSKQSKFSNPLNQREETSRIPTRLHPAVDVPTPNSQSSEQAHLRKLLEKLLPIILPEPEAKSETITSLLVEIFAFSVLGPVVELLSDSDFWNRLIEESAGNVIREQQMVEQLRHALNQQLSFMSTLSTSKPTLTSNVDLPSNKLLSSPSPQTNLSNGINQSHVPQSVTDFFNPSESISIKSTPKDFERFSKSVRRCNTLFDVRRLKNDVETQIRKTEAALLHHLELERSAPPHKNQQMYHSPEITTTMPLGTSNDLAKFLERLLSLKDIVDHRIAALGGASGPVSNPKSSDSSKANTHNLSNLAQTLQNLQSIHPTQTPSQVLLEILRDREGCALSYFTEFMDRRQRVSLIQFWLAVEGLKNPLEEEVLPDTEITSPTTKQIQSFKSYPSSIQEVTLGDLTTERDSQAMKADMRAIAEINFSTIQAINLLGLKLNDVLPLLKFLSIDLAEKHQSSTQSSFEFSSINPLNSIKDARLVLFSMQYQVFDLMLAQDLPAFAAAGDLYLRATASLLRAKPPTGRSISPVRLINIGSSSTLSDLKPLTSSKPPFAFSPTKMISSGVKFSSKDKSKSLSSDLFSCPSSPQPDHAINMKNRSFARIRANSADGSSSFIISKPRGPSHHALHRFDLQRSVQTVNENKPIAHRTNSSPSSHVLHSILRSTDGHNIGLRAPLALAPPQVTLQAAFDERLPSERLTGPTKFNHQLSNHMLSLTKPALQSKFSSSRSLLGFESSPIDNHSRFYKSSSLDLLISPSESHRAPLFQDDLHLPVSNMLSLKPISDQLSCDSLTGPNSCSSMSTFTKPQPLISSAAANALQEALSSIVSTCDAGSGITTNRSPPQNIVDRDNSQGARPLSLFSIVEGRSTNEVTHTPDSQTGKVNGNPKPSFASTPSSPVIRSAQRKGLFDDDDDDDDDDEDDIDELQILSRKSSSHPQLLRSTNHGKLPQVASSQGPSPPSPIVLTTSEADSRIMKLENELNLLSSLMRRAELTGNKLEIRLVRKSIESVSKELSEVIYRKAFLIEQKEIALGGFRGKLVPGRIRVAITGTTIGHLAVEPSDTPPTSVLTKRLTVQPLKTHIVGTAAGLLMATGTQEFTLYTIEVHKLTDEDGSFGSGWIVSRRYSEFSKLHKILKERYPISRQINFPAKVFGLGISVGLGGLGNRALVEQRKLALERYLKTLIQIPVLCESPELAGFLSRPKANKPFFGSDSSVSLQRQIELFSGSGFVKAIYNSLTSSPTDENRSYSHTMSPQSMLESLIGALKQQATEFANGINGLPNCGSVNLKTLQSHETFEMILDDPHAQNRESGSNRTTQQPAHDGDDDPDPLASLPSNIKPIEGELLTSFTAPICDLLIEVFELNDKNQWLRKQGIVIVLQQILGGTIERKIREFVSESLNDENLSQIICNFEECLWEPNDKGGELRQPSNPRSFEEKIITRDGAYRKLSAIIPELAASILGRSNARSATRRLFSMCQNRRLNKHLIYTVIDEIIRNLFPEIEI